VPLPLQEQGFDHLSAVRIANGLDRRAPDLLLHRGLQLLSHFRVAQHSLEFGVARFCIRRFLMGQTSLHLFQRAGERAFVNCLGTESFLNLFA